MPTSKVLDDGKLNKPECEGMKQKSWSARLRRRSTQKSPSGPVGTVAFYGPDNRHASKVPVGIAAQPGEKVSELRRWFEDRLDIRIDPQIGREVEAFLRTHRVRTVVVAKGIIGCPHEEGVDYPEGAECPECPFWRGKDRFEHAVPE
jgi:hypothetical protein